MNNEEKILSILEVVQSQIGEIQASIKSMDARIESMDARIESLDARIESMDARLTNVEGAIVRIEHDHGEQLQVLFDAVVANTEKLTEIQKEVTRHDDILLRRLP